MCYHASVSATYKQLEERYDRPFNGDLFPSFTQVSDVVGFHLNGFDFPLMPIITQESKQELSNYYWGLIPSFTKSFEESRKIRSLCLNAKSETIFEKPSFKQSVINKRCLVPITGFFEWKNEAETTKIPYFIHLSNETIFSLAGIYSDWFNPIDQKTYYTFSIITTVANELMSTIHNTKCRMPAIIAKENENEWLEKSLSSVQIKALLKPISSNSMNAYTISPLITSRKQSSNVPNVLKPYNYNKLDLFS
jgi:putative SOS response-associated peptidase YedK